MTIYWVLTICQILLSTLHKLSHLNPQNNPMRYVLLSLFFYLLKNFLALPRDLWDLGSSTRDGTCVLCSRRAES